LINFLLLRKIITILHEKHTRHINAEFLIIKRVEGLRVFTITL